MGQTVIDSCATGVLTITFQPREPREKDIGFPWIKEIILNPTDVKESKKCEGPVERLCHFIKIP